MPARVVAVNGWIAASRCLVGRCYRSVESAQLAPATSSQQIIRRGTGETQVRSPATFLRYPGPSEDSPRKTHPPPAIPSQASSHVSHAPDHDIATASFGLPHLHRKKERPSQQTSAGSKGPFGPDWREYPPPPTTPEPTKPPPSRLLVRTRSKPAASPSAPTRNTPRVHMIPSCIPDHSNHLWLMVET